MDMTFELYKAKTKITLRHHRDWDAWVAQSVENLPSAQIVIPGLGSSPMSGVLAQRGVCFSLCLLLPLLVLSLSVK